MALSLSKSTFQRWKEHVLTHPSFAPYIRESRFLKYLIRCLLLIHFVISIYLYYADVVDLWMILLVGAILGIAALNSAVKYQRKSRFILFLVISFFALAALLEASDVSQTYFNLILLSILSLVVVPAFPLTFKGMIHRPAIKSWRKALKNGTYPVGSQPEQKEKLIQYAIVLGVSPYFVQHYGKAGQYHELEKNLPLITNPGKTAATFSSVSISLQSSGSGFSGGSGGGGSGGGGGAGAF